ncbi:hypothetical protein [Phytohabitans rumicis]|uniref:Uncharacterized protein n=1 Tax=Phytohabitans rumicis TaxID=1076125 RepID=A0A6V8LEL9_9ACTN|nr:hypothetical protein [Phytohabitans rumicis]GFJ92487.1 hypothetical protein Prum_061290 [Phytohabitans rumicis]
MDRRYSATANAAGAATVTIRPPSSAGWTVTQVSIEMDTEATGVLCNLRKNGFLISPLVPQSDAAGGDPPVELQASDEMTVEWTGANAGDAGRVLIFYTEGT